MPEASMKIPKWKQKLLKQLEETSNEGLLGWYTGLVADNAGEFGPYDFREEEIVYEELNRRLLACGFLPNPALVELGAGI